MSKSKFAQDKAKGHKAEQIVANFFEQLGFTIEFNKSGSKKKLAGWDLKVQLDSLILFIEVKRDLKSCVTQNIAIEYHNPLKDKPSGINSTNADFWIYIIPNKEIQEIWLASTSEIKDFLDNNSPFKTIEVGGDKNASLFLYKKKDILGPLFIILNNKDKSEIMYMLKTYDQYRSIE